MHNDRWSAKEISTRLDTLGSRHSIPKGIPYLRDHGPGMTHTGAGAAMRGWVTNNCTQPHTQRNSNGLSVTCRENKES